MNIAKVFNDKYEYFNRGNTLNVDSRLKYLKTLQYSIRNMESEILDALYADLGKDRFEGYMTEVGMVLEDLGYIIKHLSRWAKAEVVHTPLSQFSAKSFVVSEPFGVVLVISPWNYPFQLAIEPLVGAISAGNCVVLKLSPYATNTNSVIIKLLEMVFPSDYVSVVEGGHTETEKVLAEKSDYIFFTGSTSLGRYVMECAAKNLTPVTLELGGKSPVIVDQTANIPLTARRIAFGKCLNAGQTCVAPDYILIHEQVKDEFIIEFRNAIRKFFPNDDYSTMGAIINRMHFDRIVGLIDDSKVVMGGKSYAEKRLIEPTLLDNVSWSDSVMQDEIFGPLLPILVYTDMDDIIRKIKQQAKPLALYLFSNDKSIQNRIISQLSFGGGCINDTIIHLATPHMGFGGVGASGMGSYHGKLSFDTFSHKKSIVKKRNWIDMSTRYRPYNEKKLKKIKMLLK